MPPAYRQARLPLPRKSGGGLGLIRLALPPSLRVLRRLLLPRRLCFGPQRGLVGPAALPFLMVAVALDRIVAGLAGADLGAIVAERRQIEPGRAVLSHIHCFRELFS